jgi:ribosomal protein S18 acetylase RimI-like enzyme
MSNDFLHIRKIEKSDIPALVKVHEESFKNFFLTELGSAFLANFYWTLSRHSNGVLTGIFEGEQLIGFAAATRLSSGFYKKLIMSFPFIYGFETLKLVFKNIRALKRLIQNLTKKNDNIQDDGQYAELLSIAVLPSKQGFGAGKKLLLDLENRLINEGVSRLALTTDKFENEKTVSFYQGLQYKMLYEFVAFPERKMLKLIKSLK